MRVAALLPRASNRSLKTVNAGVRARSDAGLPLRSIPCFFKVPRVSHVLVLNCKHARRADDEGRLREIPGRCSFSTQQVDSAGPARDLGGFHRSRRGRYVAI